jgi:hypothetical protein
MHITPKSGCDKFKLYVVINFSLSSLFVNCKYVVNTHEFVYMYVCRYIFFNIIIDIFKMYDLRNILINRVLLHYYFLPTVGEVPILSFSFIKRVIFYMLEVCYKFTIR